MLRISGIGLLRVFVGLAALATPGCGDNPHAKSAAAKPAGSVQFAIHGYYEKDGALSRVSYVPGVIDRKSTPARAQSLPFSGPGAAPVEFADGGIRTQTYQSCQGSGCDDGGTFINNEIDNEGSGFSGDALIKDIADTCQHPPLIEGAQPYVGLGGFQKPWSANSTNPVDWYTFTTHPSNCDQLLEYEEVTLCMADRLSSIADAVDTVRFVAGDKTLIFPPQELKDKFIARDLALNALAHLAQLDRELPRQWSSSAAASIPAANCSSLYGLLYDDPSPVIGHDGAFGVAFSPTPNDQPHIFSGHLLKDDADQVRDDILFRAKMKAHILGAGGILLRDVVDKSVQADLAGAETRRAQTGDPTLALQRLWGVDSDDDIAPYDSLRHALRVLFGRLEASTSLPDGNEISADGVYRARVDPRCGGQFYGSGTFAPDLINALGDGFSARWHDASPKTTQQSLAMATIGDMGLVLLPADLDQLSPATIRAVVTNQLYLHNANLQGIGVSALDHSVLDGVLAGIDDGALRFGLERSFDAYRLLTDSKANLTVFPTVAPAGLTFLSSTDTPPDLDASVTAHHGVVVSGGLQRRDILADAMGALGAAQTASECTTNGVASQPLSDNVGGSVVAIGAATSNFQDAFMVGGNLGTDMAYLRDALASGGSMASDVSHDDRTAVLTLLDGSVAGMRSWADKAIVQESYQSTEEHHVQFRITGLAPADLGVTNPVDMPNKISVLWGEAWQAECVAGIRSRCPSSGLGVLTPKNTTQIGTLATGERGVSIFLTFDNDAHPLDGVALNPKRYYVVASADPSGGRSGRILAALSAATDASQRVAGISDHQRDLANEVFGTGDQEQAGRQTCSNALTSSLPRDYCLAHMQRDMFVPLSNELNSDGTPGEESWKHYLTIAQQAATRADDLGRQMIDKGEQREIRREGGQEQLGSLCGTYVSVDSLQSDPTNGGVVGSNSDQAINDCIKPQTYDIVFLTDDPFEGVADTFEAQQVIRDGYCQVDKRPSFCEDESNGTHHIITHVGLGLPSYAPQSVDGDCSAIADAAAKLGAESDEPTMLAGLDALKAIVSKNGAYDPASIGSGLGPLRYEVGLPGSAAQVLDSGNNYYWSLKRNDDPWMATTKTLTDAHWDTLPLKTRAGIFPACLTNVTVSQLKAATPPLCADPSTTGAVGELPDCSSPCLGDARDLAKAFGASTNQNTMMYDLEAALWYAGSMAGYVPGGLFNVRVPARDTTGAPDLGTGVEAPELYSGGHFVLNDSDGTYRLYSDNSGALETSVPEALAAGTFVKPPQQYWDSRLGDENGRGGIASPPWRVSIYANALGHPQSGHLLSAAVANSAVLFDDGIVDVDGNGTVPRQKFAEWLVHFADQVKTQLGTTHACQTNGATMLAPLNTNAAIDGPELLKDSSYASIKTGIRNICPNGGASVFFEDLLGEKIHSRLYFTSEDRKENNSGGHPLDHPYDGWIALGDVVDPQGLTALPIYVDDHGAGQDGPADLFRAPYDPSTLKGGIFSLATIGNITATHKGYGTVVMGEDGVQGNLSISGECQTSGDDPSLIPPACIHLDATGLPVRSVPNPILVNSATKIASAERLEGDDYRVEFLSNRAFLGGRRLRPTTCAPSDRAELFINRYPRTNCDAAQALARGLTLSCLGAKQPKFDVSDLPPAVKTVADLRVYSAWVTSVERTLSTVFNRVALKNIPKNVVDRFKNRDFTSSVGAGKSGMALYDLANQLESLNRAWATVGSGFFELGSAVASARAQIEGADQKTQEREIALAQQDLELTRQSAMAELDSAVSEMKLAATAFPSSIGGGMGFNISWSPQATAMAALDVYAANRRQGITNKFVTDSESEIAKLRALGASEEKNSDDQILTSFESTSRHALDSIDTGVGAVRTSGNDILSSVGSVNQIAADGQWEVGKLMGADFVTVGGNAIPQYVNTVLNREYNILRIRYEAALDEAKRAAYLARLSIEQKLGVRFSNTNQAIGPLSPPSGWIDDLCSLQGIDYSKLRCVGTVDPQSGQCLAFTTDATVKTPATFDDTSSTQVQNFANQYIGDYVARLQELVEFYNVQFPFKEADDTAVLSLRDNLLTPNVACGGSPNLLFYSDDLRVSGALSDTYDSSQGWRTHRCDQLGCMSVRPGAAARNPDPAHSSADLTLPENGIAMVPPDSYGGVSWLSYRGGSAAGAVPVPADSLDPSPIGSVYQTVALKSARSYTVSWWDMPRDATGQPWKASSGPLPAYEVAVYDQGWTRLASSLITTTTGGATGTTWSERHSFDVTSPADGTYHLVFHPADTSSDADLVIANVQVEEISKTLGGEHSYVHTEGPHETTNPACGPLSQADLLASFTRRCEGGNSDPSGKAPACYYELNRNIVIDTESHNAGLGGLVGQVGVGNFNLRHVDLAVNLVGTGLLDCSQSGASSCGTSAFVEYDLQHVAYDVGIQNLQGSTQCFNFGAGGVRSGKALAAERVLTLPVASADAQLIQDPAFTKTELAGRPLSGVYRLRLKDNPALVFNRLQDIQVLLKYRYWSNVAPTSN